MARVAILIDGDNISPVHALRIAALGQKQGRVDVHRAYLNASNGSGWNILPGVKLIDAGSGKNAADLLLSIDAMEFALTGWFDTFVLARSDRDFTHLAIRLREHGSAVIGAGDERAPKDFRLACTRFEEFPKHKPDNGQTDVRPTPVIKMSDLDTMICELIDEYKSTNGGMTFVSLGTKLKTERNIGKSDLPARTLKSYLSNKPDIFELYPPENPVCVRIKPKNGSS